MSILLSFLPLKIHSFIFQWLPYLTQAVCFELQGWSKSKHQLSAADLLLSCSFLLMLTEGFPCLRFSIVGAYVYFILMSLFTMVLIQCFPTFLAYHPLETPRLGSADLIKSHKHIMTQLVFLQVLYVLARFPLLSCWVGESSSGIVGLDAVCLTTCSGVVCLELLTAWMYNLFDLVCSCASSLQSLHVSIFNG